MDNRKDKREWEKDVRDTKENVHWILTEFSTGKFKYHPFKAEWYLYVPAPSAVSLYFVQGDQNKTGPKLETQARNNRSLGYGETMFRQWPVLTVLPNLKQISLICLLSI
jgi:hypothetical protein